ncbi:MAG: hypothetical protein Q7K33_01765 [Candidatus Berkelbacteria bacterium]|nr:hypothetical protein [Candidatus Berkelbacteria bacterium]
MDWNWLKFWEIVAWPATTLIVTNNFAPEVRGVINRITQIKAGGAEVKLKEVADQDSARIEAESTLPDNTTSVIAELENTRTELQRQSEDASRDAALHRVLYHFEKTNRVIFGSQLQLLLNLQSTPGKKMHTEALRRYHAATVWGSTYPFESYIGFLETSELLKYSTSDDSYQITELGEAFIRYLKENNVPLYKPNS